MKVFTFVKFSSFKYQTMDGISLNVSILKGENGVRMKYAQEENEIKKSLRLTM